MFDFIYSSPRSGSTWLCTALNRHPKILATEQRLFGKFCEIWPNGDQTHSPRITFDAYIDTLAMHYRIDQLQVPTRQFKRQVFKSWCRLLRQYGLANAGKTIAIDKVTPYPGTSSRVLAGIQDFFPQAKLIYLIRDGRDVITSGFFDWLPRRDPQSVPYRVFVNEQTDLPLRRLFDDTFLINWAMDWAETQTTLSHAQLTHMPISFEQMASDLPSTLRTVFDYLEVEFSQSLLEEIDRQTSFSSLTGRSPGDARHLEKMRNGVSGDWKRWFTRRDAEIFCEYAGNTLQDLGYESDDSWTRRLPEELSFAQ